MKYITMIGPALDGTLRQVEIEVHEDNVKAFERSGYVVGVLPKAEKPSEAKADDAPKTKVTDKKTK